ncbi:MAG TPA: hypothetical protein VN963_11215, partial [bacterium]|nr:hypothetical protein [bacterium]
MFPVLATILLPFAVSFCLFHSVVQGPNILPVLSTFIVAPIIAALLVMIAPEKFARWISLAVASFVLGLGVKLFLNYQMGLSGFQFVEEIPWLKNLGISYILGVDGMSVLMVLLVTCVYFAGSLISWNISLRRKEYFVLFSLLVGGVAGAY